MNFYTLISKHKSLNNAKWIKKFLFLSFLISLFILIINYIVDPYNITGKNILHLKQKFASDDRTEKVIAFKSLSTFDNILIGSSRVYSINPRIVTDIVGGTTYNFGVGTATVEDLLGILKYLIRENKIPKRIIIGVDFYTFNPNIPPNSYFLQNKELNYLSYSDYDTNIFSKIFSLDALKGSLKTLEKNYLKSGKGRFDNLGYAKTNMPTIRDPEKELVAVKKEIHTSNKELIYSNMKYKYIDKKRIKYFEEIRTLAKEHKIKVFLFTTPLHPLLLEILEHHPHTKKALKEFISYLNTFTYFKNLYHDKDIYSNLKNFHGSTHTTSKCGKLILQKVLQ
jgi:hypothetical protein